MATAEQRAREEIDRLLIAAGWLIQDFKVAAALEQFRLLAGT